MLILASSSVARRKLIKMCRRNVVVKKPRVDESRLDSESIECYLQRVTYMKASAFLRKGAVVVSADTVIEAGGMIIGKPNSRDEAFSIFKMLRGKIHRCLTGVTVISCYGYEFFLEYALVKMEYLSDEEIESYLDYGEYRNRAAGYAIQGIASRFMSVVKGDITTVIGLPMRRLCRII